MQQRQTKQKQVIYEALTALNHPTATEVYGCVQRMQPTVSRATVFRVLRGFTQDGRAQELRLAGNEVRYDYNVRPHYHGRCRRCGKVVDVWTEGEIAENLQPQAKQGFSVEGYTVEFFGTCETCQN